MITLFEALSRCDESGLKLPVCCCEGTTELDALTWIKVMEVGEVPSLVKAPMGLCDEELAVLTYEQVAKIASRFADTDDARLFEGDVGDHGVENEDLNLSMDKATSLESLGESYI